MTDLDVHKLVDFDKCLNDAGVIHYVAFEPGQWRWIRYANSGLFDLDKKIKDYSEENWNSFYIHRRYVLRIHRKDGRKLRNTKVLCIGCTAVS